MSGVLFSFGDVDLHVVTTAPPYYENCYVLHHRPTNTQVVIDPGAGAGPILDRVKANGGTVAAIILTHGHPDHVASLAEIQAATGAPVLAHRSERMILDAAGEWGKALLGHAIEIPEITYFDDEPVLDLVGGLQVIATPGHTPGGVCYVGEGFSLTGDTLFMGGVGRTDFPGGDGPQLSASITRFLERVAPETKLFSGHGGEWAVSDARPWWKTMGAMMV